MFSLFHVPSKHHPKQDTKYSYSHEVIALYLLQVLFINVLGVLFSAHQGLQYRMALHIFFAVKNTSMIRLVDF